MSPDRYPPEGPEREKYHRDIENRWTERAKKFLQGNKIQDVRYMTREESEQFGFYNRPLILFLGNDTYVVVQSDDEGNDGGALYVNKGVGNKNYEEEILPVL